jgi:hypothetical protein
MNNMKENGHGSQIRASCQESAGADLQSVPLFQQARITDPRQRDLSV